MNMKVLHVSTFDRVNGASIAAYRLYRAQRDAGLDARMWVQKKTLDDSYVIGPDGWICKSMIRFRPWLDRLPLLLAGGFRNYLYSLSSLPRCVTIPQEVKAFQPDLVHLHWVQGGFLPVHSIARLPWPIVWTFHDQWPFSGMCHYPPDDPLPQKLERWETRCLKAKMESYPFSRIYGVAPSEWMQKAAKKSEIFAKVPVSVLPNPIDTSVFAPMPKLQARAELGLPTDLPLVLFAAEAGTTDPRKGFRYLEEACRSLASEGCAIGLVAFGHGSDAPHIPGVQTFGLGWLKDDVSLARAYSAVDLLVLPSLMDNLPNTAVEAQACGLPVVGFRVGGIPEIVVDEETGLLCDPRDAEGLANAIRRWLADGFPREEYRKASRERALQVFSVEARISDFIDLYQRLCTSAENLT